MVFETKIKIIIFLRILFSLIRCLLSILYLLKAFFGFNFFRFALLLDEVVLRTTEIPLNIGLTFPWLLFLSLILFGKVLLSLIG